MPAWTHLGSRIYFNGVWYMTRDRHVAQWIARDAAGRELRADSRRELEAKIAKA